MKIHEILQTFVVYGGGGHKLALHNTGVYKFSQLCGAKFSLAKGVSL